MRAYQLCFPVEGIFSYFLVQSVDQAFGCIGMGYIIRRLVVTANRNFIGNILCKSERAMAALPDHKVFFTDGMVFYSEEGIDVCAATNRTPGIMHNVHKGLQNKQTRESLISDL